MEESGLVYAAAVAQIIRKGAARDALPLHDYDLLTIRLIREFPNTWI